ncbi:hypothetical protein L1987_59528 [Smallanthus sonchifolius]|uniref:Uncharacterized protein n=1 Tax=Smallanthus sonchifolius TaxID=185202 RepID=A0ACB9D5S1_9ASTR|nr:hypothetical protein L1987_59528 [Smallanthus sonchifolius]
MLDLAPNWVVYFQTASLLFSRMQLDTFYLLSCVVVVMSYCASWLRGLQICLPTSSVLNYFSRPPSISALQGNDDEIEKKVILKLMETVDSNYIPTPECQKAKPFSIAGQGTVAPGRVEQTNKPNKSHSNSRVCGGRDEQTIIKDGDEVEILGLGQKKMRAASDVDVGTTFSNPDSFNDMVSSFISHVKVKLVTTSSMGPDAKTP